MNNRCSFWVGLFLCLTVFPAVHAQQLPDDVRLKIGDYLTTILREKVRAGRVRIDSAAVVEKKKRVELYANENFSYYPFRSDNVSAIHDRLKTLLPAALQNYRIVLYAGGEPVENLIPGTRKERFTNRADRPLVTNVSRPFRIDRGLSDRHIALWQSHGYYFEQKLSRWEWQRARIFQTVEDLYTQSYVLPYLVPMLENAGANVLLPRERDTRTAEVIVDNDGLHARPDYTESDGKERWSTGPESGFAYRKAVYVENDNPFRDGTFRMVKSIRNGEESMAQWNANLPKTGEYGVYVSYRSLPRSTEDALYTVYHKGGQSEFRVNQTMGGGTWIYLGSFLFDGGSDNGVRIALSNRSEKSGRIVTADAVKIGGGYGNVARKLKDGKNPDMNDDYQVSGYPRFTEAARYWLQWAGYPDSIYNFSDHENDYRDDYLCRGVWVNYLSGGSTVLPEKEGLNIPIDLSFGFHTDAGTTPGDSIIGTLGIYFTGDESQSNTFRKKTSRYVSRDLTDWVQTQIVCDIQAGFEPKWSRRGMWDKAYFEAATPQVPAMLLELLSHQNLADMRYGLDPRFRFLVSRAIYKGMLRFVCAQYEQPYVVQPLPVDHMSLSFTGDDEVELQWRPVADSLEPTAVPDRYVVYTRVGEGGFDHGRVVSSLRYKTRQEKGTIYSYRVTAVNDGGESFPSEILSACRMPSEKGAILVVNGFDRVSGPESFATPDGTLGGFFDAHDYGVPDGKDISFVGSQYEFRRSVPWMDDDAPGFGASHADYEAQVVAGNSFDYPALHGAAIVRAGYSFASASDEAVADGNVSLSAYPLVDLVLGKERETNVGRGVFPAQFKTFPIALQQAITDYCRQGGHIFVSGAFVATDLWDNAGATDIDRRFAREVLKYSWRVDHASVRGEVKSVASPYGALSGKYSFCNALNDSMYMVESPDALEPVGKDSYTVFRYAENNLSAGIAYKGNYRTCVLGFPFEAIGTEEQRYGFMAGLLQFMFEK